MQNVGHLVDIKFDHLLGIVFDSLEFSDLIGSFPGDFGRVVDFAEVAVVCRLAVDGGVSIQLLEDGRWSENQRLHKLCG